MSDIKETLKRLNPHLDERNLNILVGKVEAFNAKSGVRVGDVLRLPNGVETRFTYKYSDEINKMHTGGYRGYYLGDCYISYSGSLNTGIKTSDLVETKLGTKQPVWFFKDNDHRAYNNVMAYVYFRVFKMKPGADYSQA